MVQHSHNYNLQKIRPQNGRYSLTDRKAVQRRNARNTFPLDTMDEYDGVVIDFREEVKPELKDIYPPEEIQIAECLDDTLAKVPDGARTIRYLRREGLRMKVDSIDIFIEKMRRLSAEGPSHRPGRGKET